MLTPPISPMLAKLSETIPIGDFLYEPKWDGFRCIAFRDGDQVTLTSRNERPFNRYFPELLDPIRSAFPDRAVIDGEIVVADRQGRGLDFDALQQRIHPAESRVQRLAAETPAMFVAFDALWLDDDDLLDAPLASRHERLIAAIQPNATVRLTPITYDAAVAADWFRRFEGAGLDGIVAKRLDTVYSPGERTMVKVKHRRTADCAVAGYRIHKDGKGVGSLLLGVYGDDGSLHHVGVTAAFTAKYRTELLDIMQPLTERALEGHPWAGWLGYEGADRERSRWNANKDLSFVPVRVERVVEVTFGQLQSGRFRHGVQLLRWRDDRTPQSCTFDQLDVAEAVDVDRLLDLA